MYLAKRCPCDCLQEMKREHKQDPKNKRCHKCGKVELKQQRTHGMQQVRNCPIMECQSVLVVQALIVVVNLQYCHRFTHCGSLSRDDSAKWMHLPFCNSVPKDQ